MGKFWDQGLTAAEMKRCHWVKPIMVCQIKFTEWTRDDRLRQPVFLGIREDKKANEVVPGEGKLRNFRFKNLSTEPIAGKSILPMRGQGSCCLLRMGSLTRWTCLHNRL